MECYKCCPSASPPIVAGPRCHRQPSYSTSCQGRRDAASAGEQREYLRHQLQQALQLLLLLILNMCIRRWKGNEGMDRNRTRPNEVTRSDGSEKCGLATYGKNGALHVSERYGNSAPWSPTFNCILFEHIKQIHDQHQNSINSSDSNNST